MPILPYRDHVSGKTQTDDLFYYSEVLAHLAGRWVVASPRSIQELAATCMNIVKENAQDLYFDSQSSGVPATVPNPLVCPEKT
ncbi:uncharacterized protein N7473_012361 [Penicillium subrubescens]|jgi:hypothetical protein|uniref:uncharacterized protein n=1 Tax=Penicillium subrubescens TaxID=1316194 RepID=UPI0025458DD4|nr:uncharacterized protein N7473_012361 [Penicillium subrubescens]KAJ5881308.1 hypothetical protein N7473_012361 [Penicillium subrubescens]